jgi:hypothetical protein
MGFNPQPIRKLKPLNKGGSNARSGFLFQDHISLNFCLELLNNSDLSEVWCETHDDITLIWNRDGIEEVEFVQVKDLEFDQLWSIAKLCHREKKTNGIDLGTSILEKSLFEDRCIESSYFRIITSIPVMSELKLLTLPFSSPERMRNLEGLKKICDEITKKVGDLKSPKGNTINYWVERTIWEEKPTNSIADHNNNLLSKLLTEKGHNFSMDVIERQIYSPMLQHIHEISAIDSDRDENSKHITQSDFSSYLDSIIDELIVNRKEVAGKKLTEKMEKAGLSDYIDTALEERRLYRAERLNPKYLELNDHELIDGEILSTLQTLKVKMDREELPSGIDFYQICLDKMNELRSVLKIKGYAPQHYFNGCMHDITDRCFHRFHRE